jgi:hypothetical protein
MPRSSRRQRRVTRPPTLLRGFKTTPKPSVKGTGKHPPSFPSSSSWKRTMPRPTKSDVLIFRRLRFAQDFKFYRKNVVKLTQKEAAEQMGLADYQPIARVESGRTSIGTIIILCAFWADIDLRSYIDVEVRKPDQPKLL